jgi:hypothetical protein
MFPIDVLRFSEFLIAVLILMDMSRFLIDIYTISLFTSIREVISHGPKFREPQHIQKISSNPNLNEINVNCANYLRHAFIQYCISFPLLRWEYLYAVAAAIKNMDSAVTWPQYQIRQAAQQFCY